MLISVLIKFSKKLSTIYVINCTKIKIYAIETIWLLNMSKYTNITKIPIINPKLATSIV